MNPKTRLQELDALRGIAAMSVLIFHFTLNQNGDKTGWRFNYGVTGVDIFFMISGFVIFLTLNKIKVWQEFVTFRFARLYPTYWVCMLLTTTVILIHNPTSIDVYQFLANLTMAPAFFGEEVLDGSYWTLLVELLFYFWMLIIYMTKNLKHTVTIGFFFTVGIILFHYFKSHYPDFYWISLRKAPLLCHFPLFFSGILFYNLKVQPFSFRTSALILFSLAAALYLHDKGGRAMYIITALEHKLILIFFHVVFALFVLNKLNFLVKPTLLFLGKISYSLYLLHQYMGVALMDSLTEKLHFNIYIALASAIAMSIGLATLVTFYVEVPVIRFIHNWYKIREVTALKNKPKL